jgi:CspA family cold shock protein
MATAAVQTRETTGFIKAWGSGYGFLVSEDIEGDVLVHKSVLRPHQLNSLPVNARLELTAVQTNRGWNAVAISSVDCSDAMPLQRMPVALRRASGPAGEFEPVEVKWFNYRRGFGFLLHSGGDVFVHAEVIRAAGIVTMNPGYRMLARIAPSERGLIATELRL